MTDFVMTPEDDVEIDRIISETEIVIRSDYVFDGETSFREDSDDVTATLRNSARRVRNYIRLRRNGMSVTEAKMGDINGE